MTKFNVDRRKEIEAELPKSEKAVSEAIAHLYGLWYERQELLREWEELDN